MVQHQYRQTSKYKYPQTYFEFFFRTDVFVGVAVAAVPLLGSLETTTGTATRTSPQNINSRNCNHFATTPSFFK